MADNGEDDAPLVVPTAKRWQRKKAELEAAAQQAQKEVDKQSAEEQKVAEVQTGLGDKKADCMPPINVRVQLKYVFTYPRPVESIDALRKMVEQDVLKHNEAHATKVRGVWEASRIGIFVSDSFLHMTQEDLATQHSDFSARILHPAVKKSMREAEEQHAAAQERRVAQSSASAHTGSAGCAGSAEEAGEVERSVPESAGSSGEKRTAPASAGSVGELEPKRQCSRAGRRSILTVEEQFVQSLRETEIANISEHMVVLRMIKSLRDKIIRTSKGAAVEEDKELLQFLLQRSKDFKEAGGSSLAAHTSERRKSNREYAQADEFLAQATRLVEQAREAHLVSRAQLLDLHTAAVASAHRDGVDAALQMEEDSAP